MGFDGIRLSLRVESPWSFHMLLPTWHGNSLDYFTWNPMESSWRISHVYFLIEIS